MSKDNCRRVGGNNSAKHRGMNRSYKAVCGKTYAMENARDRHNKQYHGMTE